KPQAVPLDLGASPFERERERVRVQIGTNDTSGARTAHLSPLPLSRGEATERRSGIKPEVDLNTGEAVFGSAAVPAKRADGWKAGADLLRRARPQLRAC